MRITRQSKSTLNESCYKIKYVTLLPIFTLKLKRILSFTYLFSCSEDIENALKEKKIHIPISVINSKLIMNELITNESFRSGTRFQASR